MRLRRRIERNFKRIEFTGGLLVFLLVLVYVPVRGGYSVLTGVGIVAGGMFLTALNLRPRWFQGASG